MGPLLFLVYINDITKDLKTDVKLFADDTSIFSVVHNPRTAASYLEHDLKKLSEWAFQWKMEFNPYPKKPAQEINFSRKRNANQQVDVFLNNQPIEQNTSTKHLGFILDQKLSFL